MSEGEDKDTSTNENYFLLTTKKKPAMTVAIMINTTANATILYMNSLPESSNSLSLSGFSGVGDGRGSSGTGEGEGSVCGVGVLSC